MFMSVLLLTHGKEPQFLHGKLIFMKSIIIIFCLFISVSCFSQKKDSLLNVTDSTAILSIRDINAILTYLSTQEMKPATFLLFKNAIDQVVQKRVKEFIKPKK